MSLIECKCFKCGKPFLKRKAEHNRSTKLNRKEFCNKSCAANYGNTVKRKYNKECLKNLQKGKIKDQYSPFRWHIRVTKKRARINSMNIKILIIFLKKLL